MMAQPTALDPAPPYTSNFYVRLNYSPFLVYPRTMSSTFSSAVQSVIPNLLLKVLLNGQLFPETLPDLLEVLASPSECETSPVGPLLFLLNHFLTFLQTGSPLPPLVNSCTRIRMHTHTHTHNLNFLSDREHVEEEKVMFFNLKHF